MDKMGRGEDLVKISDITYDYRSIFTFYLAMIFFDFVVNKVYLVFFVCMNFQKHFVVKPYYFLNHFRISLCAEKGAEKVVTCCPAVADWGAAGRRTGGRPSSHNSQHNQR